MEKRHLKISIIALLVLLIASTSVMIYLSNLKAVAFDLDFYRDEFVKYDIHSRFSEDTDLDSETAFLLDYLEHGEGEIQTGFFNEKEKIHLVEVRELFALASTILNIAVVISIASLLLLLIAIKHASAMLSPRKAPLFFKRLIVWMLIGIGAAVDGIAALFALVALTFSSSFIRFHEIFFRTDTWLLNPATDNLIRMFPEAFFFDIFVRIVLTSVVFATILLIAGFLIKLGRPRMMKKPEK